MFIAEKAGEGGDVATTNYEFFGKGRAFVAIKVVQLGVWEE